MDRFFPKSLEKSWKDPKSLIQIFTGPRQVGKTTTALTLRNKKTSLYASADQSTPPTIDFIQSHWEKARDIQSPERTLILDEIQKIPNWSEKVKSLWDEDRRNKIPLKIALLGSSALLIEKGLSESLMGRFELHHFPHWTFKECHENFKASLENYILAGGYPKAYDFINEEERLDNYIQNSILEPSLGRDILSLHSVEKPALLRQLFWYVSRLPAHIVSFEKILSHLQGRGNSATLVHYADLLSKAFLLIPLSKFSSTLHRTKKSIPKWILPNPALVETSLKQKVDGFVFENIVASHLLNICFGQRRYSLKYWREDSWELDFILCKNNLAKLAIEVKSGRVKKIPSAKKLKDKGIHCPLLVISQENILEILKYLSIDELIKDYE